ncbi:2-phosphosulfolactate phosphatase family protein [Picrophilus oshimae]|uniref:2-phosphosulfolactate phosphatase n=1 Tax=Picrophilus torridus (strain ATCC 700027 / DSM 9790 / JCM 10055 / NBRC 100828 / KAW 2/3) TaxID=1122961 RepID=Q6L1Y1_PICTO|nr:2-phosphosulfolactate phosphatase family protein [Picrophilus oshimae]AAT43021.1 hypothetical 2-phosphosulfolactate phosphatase [Picrophilus oshimae DSM 9789]SMD30677.1 2-phosphosulfolactate phosphatase [Picrophilus oshimae DSM 9789]
MINIVDGRRTRDFSKNTKVLIDIYRSTTTISIALMNGVSYIIPARSIKDAFSLRKRINNSFISGERYGMRIPGFDYGNSPSEIINLDLSGKIMILTSTNGIKVLFKLLKFPGDIFISSYINFSATVRALTDKDVDIIVSNRPDGTSDEDLIFAELLRKALLNDYYDVNDYIDRTRRCSGSRRLKLMGFEDDIENTLKIDIYNKAIVYRDNKIISL